MQGVALPDRVIQGGRQQVVGLGDGVQIAGEVQVDGVGGNDLSATAPGGPALASENGTHGGLAQGRGGVHPQLTEGVYQADGNGRFAFPGDAGGHGGDQHQFALTSRTMDGRQANFEGIPAIGNEVLGAEIQALGNFEQVFHRASLAHP